jgi:hypothetical protein
MNTVSITGAAAEVRWAYHHVATLASWSVTADAAGGGSLTATVVDLDTFRSTQQPLTFVVPRPTGQPWRWRIESLQIVGQTVTARLEPTEE